MLYRFDFDPEQVRAEDPEYLGAYGGARNERANRLRCHRGRVEAVAVI